MQTGCTETLPSQNRSKASRFRFFLAIFDLCKFAKNIFRFAFAFRVCALVSHFTKGPTFLELSVLHFFLEIFGMAANFLCQNFHFDRSWYLESRCLQTFCCTGLALSMDNNVSNETKCFISMVIRLLAVSSFELMWMNFICFRCQSRRHFHDL